MLQSYIENAMHSQIVCKKAEFTNTNSIINTAIILKKKNNHNQILTKKIKYT